MKFQFKMFPVIAFAVGALLASDWLMAQPGERGGNRFQGRGGFFGAARGGGSLGLLGNEQVQREVELDDDQLTELREIQDGLRQMMRDMFSGIRDVPAEERGQAMEELRGKMQERMKEFEQRANDLLLPHQQKRLKQLAYQSSGRGRGAGGALANEELLKELGVSEVQREELEAAAARAREELQKKYQKLLVEAETEILEVLTKEQRDKYRELVGDPFQFDNGRNRAFGFRGDRGEQGRGGRDRGGDRSRRDF